ncbi:MAG: c-type cytochrome [Rhodocyclaceae bacterium]|nr:c-type cytochrome [Rhodocyclaceae bacterium]
MRGWVMLALSFFAFVVHAEPSALYQQHCASCHGSDRIGLMGPALLPESLERLRKPEALKVITQGRAATQMQGFADRLSAEEIAALTDYIYSPSAKTLSFTDVDIRASRIVHADKLPAQPAKPLQGRDLMNLFLVVETGDHHVSVLDGDKLEVVHRFASRYALHGGPKFTEDGRYVFFASRDGWITKYDIWNLTVVAEVRAGINTRNVAVSPDGQFLAVANYLPNTLVLLDGELNLLKVHAVSNADKTATSRVSAVYEASPRKSFIAALKDLPEVWEISYNPRAEDIATGFIHDFQYKEGAFVPGFLNPRRSKLPEALDDFYFTPNYSELMGAGRTAGKGRVVNLDVRKVIADLDISGMPHLGSGISFDWSDGAATRRVMASPNLKEGSLTIIDMKDWSTLKRIATNGPGFFVRSHENSPYFWADAMMSKNKNRIEIFDKRTLEKAGEVAVEEGKTLAHVEFDRYGNYVLASLWERKRDGGALIVYDAATFKELKRLPMDKPVGKYNLHNKISRSEGTSH